MKRNRWTWFALLLLGVISLSFALLDTSGGDGSISDDVVDDGVTALTPAGDAVEEQATGSFDPEFLVELGDTLVDISQETISFWARIGKVDFPHLMHIDDFGMACVDCHHETNATSLDIPHAEYFEDFWIDCATCHDASGDAALEPQACSDCHPANPIGIADETLSSKVVIHRLCWDCHDSGTGTDASESCATCHTGAKTSFMEPLPDSLRNQ